MHDFLFTRSVVLAVVALSAGALAQSAGGVPRAARLLDRVADAPVLALADGQPEAGVMPAQPVVASPAIVDDGPSYGVHFGKTLAVGVASPAVGAVLGYALAQLSNNLGVALAMVMLSNLFVGPVATTLTAFFLGNDGKDRYGFWLPFAGAFVLNAAVYFVTSLVLQVAVSWGNPVSLLVYCLVDGVLMTGGSVGLMHLLPKREAPAAIRSFVPGVSDTQFVATSTVRF